MSDPDGLDPRLERRLRSALDRVQPRHSPPRYAEAAGGVRRWGAAQGVLAAGIASLMILTLLAAASSRSMDLQHRIVNTFQSATEPSPPAASPSPSPVQVQQPAPPAQQATPRPEPAETPEPSQRPEPGDSSPEPSGEHSGSSPSPTPGDR